MIENHKIDAPNDYNSSIWVFILNQIMNTTIIEHKYIVIYKYQCTLQRFTKTKQENQISMSSQRKTLTTQHKHSTKE